MAKDSRVRFTNDYEERITIRPVRSSKNDDIFEKFTLEPGESAEIRASNPGLGRYDIEWDVLINPAGKRNDRVAGEFRVDNPAITAHYLQSLDPNVWEAQLENHSCERYGTGRTKYIDSSWGLGTYSDKKFGTIIRDKIFDCQEYSMIANTNVSYGWFSSGEYDAFDKSLPIFNVDKRGLRDGAYTWDIDIV